MIIILVNSCTCLKITSQQIKLTRQPEQQLLRRRVQFLDFVDRWYRLVYAHLFLKNKILILKMFLEKQESLS